VNLTLSGSRMSVYIPAGILLRNTWQKKQITLSVWVAVADSGNYFCGTYIFNNKKWNLLVKYNQCEIVFYFEKTHINKNKIKSVFAYCLFHRSYLLYNLLMCGLRWT
jgi:hypothetical protein